MNILDFSRAFQENQILHSSFGEMILTPYCLDELVLISGKLVVCDPLVFPDTEPFFSNLSPGRYPVIMSLARTCETKPAQNAFAMLRLSENTPVRWELATKVGEDINLLPEGQVFGYGVDSGTSCFMDEVAARAIVDSLGSAEIYEETWIERIEEGLLKSRTSICSWTNLVLDSDTGANIIAFDTALGDGFYASYFGYDAENNIVSVVLPFLSGEFE